MQRRCAVRVKETRTSSPEIPRETESLCDSCGDGKILDFHAELVVIHGSSSRNVFSGVAQVLPSAARSGAALMFKYKSI